jgi:hypothetical protein
MKRVNKLIVGFLVVLVIMSAGTAAVMAQNRDQVAFILSINGKLEVRHDASGNWTAAKRNDPLYNGSQLRTGTGNKAMIQYPASGTRVLINENTTIEVHAEITSPGSKPASERTKILAGEIYNQARGNYQVETPSSVASVRGTEFNVQSTDDVDTFIGVEGVIDIMNQFGSVILNQYQRTTSQKGQAPTPPQNLTENETKKLTSWTDGVMPTWRLNMIPENGTDQNLGNGFTLSIFAYRNGSIDQNATFRLTAFGSSSRAVEFSTDGGRNWVQEAPAITIVNGQAAINCRVTEAGQAVITAEAADAESAILNLSVTAPKDKKRLELEFTEPNGGGGKTLIWELEEK